MKLPALALALASLSVAAFAQTPAPAPAPAPRLLCLFFDLRSLPASDLAAAQMQAIDFVQQQAAPADQISVITYTSQLNVLQDFTMDHNQLVGVLRGIMPGEAAGFDEQARLRAIVTVARLLGAVPQKKAVIYFASPLPSNPGNRPDFAASVRTLMDANVSLFPVDSRGFQFH